MSAVRRDEGSDLVRVDKWLWAERFFKTRSAAAQAVDDGKVHVNEARIKPSKQVHVGDQRSIQIGAYRSTISVLALSGRRGPASIARELYCEHDASRQQRVSAVAECRSGVGPFAEHGERPRKKQRRQLARLRGY